MAAQENVPRKRPKRVPALHHCLHEEGEPSVEPIAEAIVDHVVEPVVEPVVAPLLDSVLEHIVESVFPLVEAVVSAPLELELHPTGTISDEEEEPVRPPLLMRLPKSAGKGICMSSPPPSPTNGISLVSSVPSVHSLASERSSSGVSSEHAAKRTREEDDPERKPGKFMSCIIPRWMEADLSPGVFTSRQPTNIFCCSMGLGQSPAV